MNFLESIRVCSTAALLRSPSFTPANLITLPLRARGAFRDTNKLPAIVPPPCFHTN